MERLGEVIWRPVDDDEIEAAIINFAAQPSQQAAEQFIRSALPILKKLLPHTVRRLPDDLRDDLVSHVTLKLLQVLPRIAATQSGNLCGYLGFVVKNAAMDFFRREQLWRARASRASLERRESGGHGGFQKVENDDLLESITEYVAARDGQWGPRVIGVVVRLLARDEPIPAEMIQNFLQVHDPGRLIRFVKTTAKDYFCQVDYDGARHD